MAYEILGPEHLFRRTPLVLIGGMSSLRGDWQRLAKGLANERAVLVFDHRGMGDSTLLPGQGAEMTTESLARDLLDLLRFLEWEELAICGFSMGGVIAQHLLFLPYLSHNPTPLPFRVTHVFLTGTMVAPLKDKQYGLKITRLPPSDRRRTVEEKKEIAKSSLEATFDPRWLADAKNSERFHWWLHRMIHGRPTRTILQQARAMGRFDFRGLHEKLSKDIHFLVIHGELDEIVPFYCGQRVFQSIPWSKMVEIGLQPGQVPNLAFGHHWFEYFDIQVWQDVFRKFMEKPNSRLSRAHL